LTDPAIHTAKSEFRDQGDFGQTGMIRFFRFHKCNDYCKKLGLSLHHAQKDNDSKILRESVVFDVKELYRMCQYFYCCGNAIGTSTLCNECLKKGVTLDIG